LGIFQREPNLGRDLDVFIFFWIWEILEELFCFEANKGLETGDNWSLKIPNGT
jgi:hypothetical protein